MDEVVAGMTAPRRGMLVLDEYAERALAGRATPDELVHAALTAPGLSSSVSSILLSRPPEDEPPAGVVLGICGPTGSRPTPSPHTLDGLAASGVRFVELRANRAPAEAGSREPTVHVDDLVERAALVQDAGLVALLTVAMPDLETHSSGVARAVTGNAVRALLDRAAETLDLRRLLLRVNMISAGTRRAEQSTPDQVAEATVAMLRRDVPEAVPGVFFLSGGQSLADACQRLSAVTALARSTEAPWHLSFAFTRAVTSLLEQPLDARPTDWTAVQRQLVTACETAAAALGAPDPDAPS